MRRPDPQKEERDLYVHFSHTCLYTDAYMYALFCADTAEHIDVYTHVHVYVDAHLATNGRHSTGKTGP